MNATFASLSIVRFDTCAPYTYKAFVLYVLYAWEAVWQIIFYLPSTNWYCENSYFDRDGESELVVLPLTYDRSREWRFNRIGYVIYNLCYTGF